jgi:hypothetical protein
MTPQFPDETVELELQISRHDRIQHDCSKGKKCSVATVHDWAENRVGTK